MSPTLALALNRKQSDQAVQEQTRASAAQERVRANNHSNYTKFTTREIWVCGMAATNRSKRIKNATPAAGPTSGFDAAWEMR